MTTKVKAKPLSQIRAEEKARKIAKRTRRLQEQMVLQNQLAQAKPQNNNLYQPIDTQALLDPVRIIQEKIKERTAGQTDDNMPLEDYFVKEVNSLDLTLTEIVAAIQGISKFRKGIQWDARKHMYAEDKVKEFDEKLGKLEADNKQFEDLIVASVTKSVEELEALKLEPSRDGVNEYTLNASTRAFAIFADWNDVILVQFHYITDLIDNLQDGEDK